MGADVFEFVGDNPPGLDVISKHDVVLWKSPQYGWVKAQRNGSFIPISEAAALQLKGPVPAPTPTPEAQLGVTGAGSTAVNKAQMRDPNARGSELARAKAESEHQATMDRAKFMPQEQADPMAGLGLTERAEVDRLVRGGAKLEDAVAEVRKKMPPPASTQAEALKQ